MRISDWSSDVCSSDLPSQHFVPAHWRNTSTGAFDGKVVSREAFPHTDRACGDNRLARYLDIIDLASGSAFDASAQRYLYVSDGRHHSCQLMWFQAGSMIGARQATIQSEVLFDHRGA